MPNQTFTIGCLLLAMAGCAGDPDLGAMQAPLDASPIERDLWVRAPPGCEDSALGSARLHPAAGEPLLGVLLDATGHVLCVDSMVLLAQETRRDPTPTPLTPRGGPLHDPTPTPALDD